MSVPDVEVICLGMAVADILARGVPNEIVGGATTVAEEVTMSVGGDALNEAITLSKLGHSVMLMTLVGADPQGKFLLEQCKTNGVNVAGVTVSHRYPTSTSIVLIRPDGERSFISQKGGTVDEYSLDDIDVSLIKLGVKVVSVGSLFCSKRLDVDALPIVLRRAKEIGAITLADLVLNNRETKLEDVQDVLSYLDYIIPSEEEAIVYTGKRDLDDIAEVFLSYGVKNVVIKLGSKGVYARTARESKHLPVYPSEVIDATGAGDNFVAGFISALARGGSLTDCLQFGSATAAISIQFVGATTGVKDQQQVKDFIREHRQQPNEGGVVAGL
jgi:sugar/nucleoside kinase (ribokinase family)